LKIEERERERGKNCGRVKLMTNLKFPDST